MTASAKKVEANQIPQRVEIDTGTLSDAWSLIATREWPVSMISTVADVKNKFERAIEESQVEEDKGSD
jgi:hypothetical protein